MTLAVFGPQQAILVVVLLVAIAIAIVYLLTLQNTLKQVERANRQVEPGNVWLMLIPLFNVVYAFFLYPQICDSVKAEYRYRGLNASGDFGRSLGVTMPILSICRILPVIGPLSALANLVIFIIFWAKMAGYKSKLESTPRGQGDISTNDEFIISNSDLLDN